MGTTVKEEPPSSAGKCPSSNAEMSPKRHARTSQPPNVTQSHRKSALVSLLSKLGTSVKPSMFQSVPVFQDSSVPVPPVKHVPAFLDNNASMFHPWPAKMLGKQFRLQLAKLKPWNNVSMFQDSSVGRFLLKLAYLFPAPTAHLFPGRAASIFLLRSVHPDQERSVPRFPGSSAEEEAVAVVLEDLEVEQEDSVEELEAGLEAELSEVLVEEVEEDLEQDTAVSELWLGVTALGVEVEVEVTAVVVEEEVLSQGYSSPLVDMVPMENKSKRLY